MTKPPATAPKVSFRLERSDFARAGIPEAYLRARGERPELFPPGAADLPGVLARRLEYYRETGLREPVVAAWTAAYRRLGLGMHPLLERLANPDSAAVVSGQQAGLLAGPLYTHYKIIGSIALAAELPNAVPVFWNAAEDSDLLEIAECVAPGRAGEAVFRHDVGRYPEGTMAAGVPAADVDLPALFAWWDEHLRHTDFTDDLFALLRETRDASASLGDWMTHLLARLYGDRLLLFDPSWPELRPLGLPLVERELAAPAATAHEVNAAAAALRDAGLAPRIHRPEDRTSIFYVEGAVRHRVTWDGERLTTMDRRETVAEFVARLHEDPTRWSAGATLRPVLQDYLLPTAAVCVGPGELEYHCQLEGTYQRLGVPRPAVLLRPTATLLEPPAERRLKKLDLPWRRLSESREALGKSLAGEGEGERTRLLLEDLRGCAASGMQGLRDFAKELDPTLNGPVEKQEKLILRALDQLQDLFLRRIRDRDVQLLDQLSALSALLFPGGHPQERRLSIFYFLNKYGPGFLPALVDALPAPGADFHALLTWTMEES